MRILVIGPSWVGDMMVAQSLFKLLCAQRPGAKIDVLAPAWSQPLLAKMPEVNQAFISPFQHGEIALKKRFQLAISLRDAHYQQAFVLPGSFKSALIPLWANIPLRTGQLGEWRWGLLNDVRRLDLQKFPRLVDRYLALGVAPHAVLPVGDFRPKLSVSLEQQQTVLETFALTLSRPVLALCPGAEFGNAKRWPEAYYAEIAQRAVAKGWQVWLFGSERDMPVSQKIEQLAGVPCQNLTGATRLEQAVDLLSLASVVLSNDSGLMHIAAALQRPLVAVYGPTPTSTNPPLHDASCILTQTLACQPCRQRECPLNHHACMRQLTPDIVWKEVESIG